MLLRRQKYTHKIKSLRHCLVFVSILFFCGKKFYEWKEFKHIVWCTLSYQKHLPLKLWMVNGNGAVRCHKTFTSSYVFESTKCELWTLSRGDVGRENEKTYDFSFIILRDFKRYHRNHHYHLRSLDFFRPCSLFSSIRLLAVWQLASVLINSVWTWTMIMIWINATYVIKWHPSSFSRNFYDLNICICLCLTANLYKHRAA